MNITRRKPQHAGDSFFAGSHFVHSSMGRVLFASVPGATHKGPRRRAQASPFLDGTPSSPAGLGFVSAGSNSGESARLHVQGFHNLQLKHGSTQTKWNSRLIRS